MPFKDTPGLRRIAAMALEERDLVRVQVRPLASLVLLEHAEIREGQVLTMSRRRAHNLAEHGIVDLLDASG
jgi:hypothetical protein